MANRVTIQDIADALGISRNTVSKAINNTPGLAEATRKKVLQKAAELGYKQFSFLSLTDQAPVSQADATTLAAVEDVPLPTGEIALFTTEFFGGFHFAVTMLDRFQRDLSQLGYVMTMHRLSAQEVQELRLPMTFRRERTSGIVCVELFNCAYTQMLCDLGMPLLFVDAPVDPEARPLRADRLLMDNTDGIFQFVGQMMRTGRRNLGFIGCAMHCQSFYERYAAFRNAVDFFGGTVQERFCLTGTYQNQQYPTVTNYRVYLKEQLSALEELPDVFLCANDFLAVDTIIALRELGIRVPEDVHLCGFDDFPEARIVTPPLTTIHIHSQTMGLAACQLILSRIREPELNFRTVHVEANLIYRESAPMNPEKEE